MAVFLLVGAGFSRNWGGWLATEAFEHLLGSPEIAGDPALRRLLWGYQDRGGFEGALTELQARYTSDPNSARSSLMAFQDAVKRMFDDMNEAFMADADWQFGQRSIQRQISTFLTRFDAIFTLNQDVLLEHHYVHNVGLIGNGKWRGSELPGMRRKPPKDSLHANSWSRSTWIPLSEDSFRVEPGNQAIYKLHGSSNWTRADGQSLLIMGGAKAREIRQHSILQWYFTVFEESISATDTKLMIIGYGFRDDHINAALARAVEKGLKLFIVAPEGAELAKRINPTRAPGHIVMPSHLEELIEKSLVGASRRGLREIFGRDEAEFRKIMRFF